MEDSGLYECQVSTTPVMSHYIYLTVAEPYTEIVGGAEIYLDEGSMMNITCLVKDSPEPPNYIFWYHNKKVSIHYFYFKLSL
jgi:neurotrimin